MTRKPRKPEQGAIYHLIAKGNQGDFILDEAKNKQYFIECLKKAVEDYQALVYAYCIMGNHYHVILQNTEANLSEIMHDVGSSFASNLRKQGRIGHIFSGRYKSIYLEGRERLLYLSKYIHLNPVRASIVERPEDFDWSSYRFFAWDLEPPEWLYADWLKGCHKPAGKMMYKSYREFVEGSANLPSDSEENRGTARAIIKCERFLQDIMDDGCEGKAKDTPRLESLYGEVCRYYGINGLELPAGTHTLQDLKLPRAMFIYLAREYTFAASSDIGKRIGVSPSTISSQYKEFLTQIERKDRRGKELRKETAAIASSFWTPHPGI